MGGLVRDAAQDSCQCFGPTVLRAMPGLEFHRGPPETSGRCWTRPRLIDDPVFCPQNIGRRYFGPRLQRCDLVVRRLWHPESDCRKCPVQRGAVAVVEHERPGSIFTVGSPWVGNPILMEQAVAEDLVGRRSANVGKARGNEHQVIYRSEHRHHGNDQAGTRSADQDDSFNVPQDLCNMGRTFQRVCVVEVPWVQVDEHSSYIGVGEIPANPIPATGTLGTTVHERHCWRNARHRSRLSSPSDRHRTTMTRM